MSKPNFLFFITDQHRADYLGCAGHPIVKTPNIDAIAAAGTRFERFYVAMPVCMPNRSSLLTGRYPSAHGVRKNGDVLSYRANTFVDVLRAGGYRTAHIGKSHVQSMTGMAGEERVDPDSIGPIQEAWKDDGADYGHEMPDRYEAKEKYAIPTPYYGYEHVDMVTGHGDQCSGHYNQWLREQSPDADAWRDPKNQLPHNYSCPQARRTPIPEELYPTAFIRDKTLEYLDANKDNDTPFFTFVSFPDPHHPFTPPGKYWDMYDPADFSHDLPYEAHKNPNPAMQFLRERHLEGKRQAQTQEAFMADDREVREAKALTCGMITMIDDAIGAIIDKLKATGQFDNTVIVFNADHGDYLGDYGLVLKGALPFDGITRVPFIWSDPADRAGRISQALASTIDLAPTIIARAGLKPYFGIQGQDLSAPIAGDDKTLRDCLLTEHEDNFARMGFPTAALLRNFITRDWRLTLYRGEDWGELYDLKNDPHESSNLWNDPAHAGVRAELTNRLVHEMLDQVDTSPRAASRA
jgi:arylsulfatase A-like enzyme